MLGSIFWIDGRNSRTKWWTIQLIYGCFIGFIWLNFAPTGAFVLLAHDPVQNQAEMAREAAMLSNLQALDRFVTIAAIPIWWLTMVNNIRRYHDINKSGWWAINTFIPFFGNIWQIVQIGFTPGTRGPNDYGPQPGTFFPKTSENEDGGSQGGSLAKIDDNYLAEYAKRYAAEQAARTAPQAPAPAAAPTGPGGAGGSFGKRR